MHPEDEEMVRRARWFGVTMIVSLGIWATIIWAIIRLWPR